MNRKKKNKEQEYGVLALNESIQAIPLTLEEIPLIDIVEAMKKTYFEVSLDLKRNSNEDIIALMAIHKSLLPDTGTSIYTLLANVKNLKLEAVGDPNDIGQSVKFLIGVGSKVGIVAPISSWFFNLEEKDEQEKKEEESEQESAL